jgi:alpha-L-fucosidase
VKQVFFTQKADTLYAISAGWPGKNLTLRDVTTDAASTQITLLGFPATLPYTRNGADITLVVPALGPDEAPCSYAYTFKITHATVAPEKADSKPGTSATPPRPKTTTPGEQPPTN